MDTMTYPKIFISYAHADGESGVKDFWNALHAFLRTPERRWDKWDDKEILLGQEWDNTIISALEKGCNCCLLLVSDLFAKSTYIIDKEWPKTLARYESSGIVFFPVVFGVLEGGLKALPESMLPFQVYWPTVAELFALPLDNVPKPDLIHLCYKDAKEKDAARDRFLSRLAKQMNDRFDEYLRKQATMKSLILTSDLEINTGQFVTNASDEETFAKAIFGSFSFEKRYRDSNSKGHYFLRQIDTILDERLRRSDWVLVEGHPLAGKTRALFEAIKRLMLIGMSVAIWPFKLPERTDLPLIIPVFPEADCRIVWIDDIDTQFRDMAKKGYDTNEINCFLLRIADAGIILAATTRTGPDYYDFRHRFGLDDHLWDKLESLSIPRLEDEEEKAFSAWYLANFGTSLPDKFDHHPGSLFLNLETMSDRWHNMDKIARVHKLSLNVERAKDILRALHVFYVMESYHPGGLFLEEDIRFYLRRIAEHRKTAHTMGAAFAKAQLFYQPYSSEEWETLIEFLSQDKFHLGFLRREENYLHTETAYLDYVVAPNGERNIAQTIAENFTNEERIGLGLMVTSYNFGDIFRRNPPKSEKDLLKLARKLKSLGLGSEVTAWNQLIRLCPTLQLARISIELLKSVGLAPDEVTYGEMVAKAQDYDSARAVIEEMLATGITPDTFTYTKLVAKAKDYEIACAIIEEMKRSGIAPNIFTYNTLIAKTQGYDSAQAVIEEMKVAKVAPNIETYNLLVSKDEDFEKVRTVIEEMKTTHIAPNVDTYNRLVSMTQDIDTVRIVIEEMKAKKIAPNIETYKVLVSRTKDDKIIRAIIEEMKVAKITPNHAIYNALVTRTQDMDIAHTVIEEMKTAKIAPNVDTYNVLAAKAQSYRAVRGVMEEMNVAGVIPNRLTYHTLVANAKNYETGRAIIEEMNASGFAPNLTTYTLVAKAQDEATARALHEEMRAKGIGTLSLDTQSLISAQNKTWESLQNHNQSIE